MKDGLLTNYPVKVANVLVHDEVVIPALDSTSVVMTAVGVYVSSFAISEL